MSESSGSFRARRMSSNRHSSMSTIETSVTRLLVSTKHLLESLTQWARQEADDKFVSDAYVKLGNDFRAAARSFTSAGVDISDLGDVPKALRIVLESALSEAPTQANLDKFLPNIRNIIVTLLSNLKAKQNCAKELALERALSPQLHNFRHSNSGEDGSASASASAKTDSSAHLANGTRVEAKFDEKECSSERPRRSKLLRELSMRANAEKHEEDMASDAASDSTPDTAPMPSPENGTMPASASSDALAKLQSGNVIVRRASKRYSAYQFAKLTNIGSSQFTRISQEHSVSPNGADAGKHSRTNSVGNEISAVHADLPTFSVNEYSEPHVFLRIDDRTKKVRVAFPVTLASLRLLFVETFAYTPKSSSFPEIYVLDPRTSVPYELEEQEVDSEIKIGSLLLLKTPSHREDLLKDLEGSVRSLNTRMDNLAKDVVMQVKEAITSNPVMSISSPRSSEISKGSASSQSSKDLEKRNLVLTKALKSLQAELKGVQKLSQKRDTQVKELTEVISSEISALKAACLEENSPGKNRSFMEESYSKLSEDSDCLLTRVDDLQDVMEALRKDVAQRGVRLSKKQLKSTQKEITEVKSQLQGLSEYIRDGKPSWKKIWESELDKVCEEQQFFNLQDDLTRDLDEDIHKIEETFELIEKCCVHQSKLAPKRTVFASRMILTEANESVRDVRDAVLCEVSALKPNHETRLDAIAKAEKLRQREREWDSLSQFQEELGEFVDAKKLKGQGGIEELEKKRQQRDAENLKIAFGIV